MSRLTCQTNLVYEYLIFNLRIRHTGPAAAMVEETILIDSDDEDKSDACGGEARQHEAAVMEARQKNVGDGQREKHGTRDRRDYGALGLLAHFRTVPKQVRQTFACPVCTRDNFVSQREVMLHIEWCLRQQVRFVSMLDGPACSCWGHAGLARRECGIHVCVSFLIGWLGGLETCFITGAPWGGRVWS